MRLGSPIQPILLVAMILTFIVLPGCVRRRMTIRSNPPGALVYVDNYEIGTTPCSTDFIYYGTREVRLEKDGYETLHVQHPFHRPWYQWPAIDFIAENLVPAEVRDEHFLNYEMTPQLVVPTEKLLERAENLRRGVQTASATVPLTGSQLGGALAQPTFAPAGPSQQGYSGLESLPPGGRIVPEPVPVIPGSDLPAGPSFGPLPVPRQVSPRGPQLYPPNQTAPPRGYNPPRY